MNLAQHVEQLFASFSPEEMDALLKKANFDHFNAVGGDILSPEEANRKETLVTAERQEAWIAALQEDAK